MVFGTIVHGGNHHLTPIHKQLSLMPELNADSYERQQAVGGNALDNHHLTSGSVTI